MISMTTEQLEKIELLDKLFGAMGVAELKQYVESEQIISKLKGTNPNPNILYRLIQGHDIQSMEMMNLKSELSLLKCDIETVVKVMSKPYETYLLSEFNNLKSRYNIY